MNQANKTEENGQKQEISAVGATTIRTTEVRGGRQKCPGLNLMSSKLRFHF